jgi:RHS repeat-associated protein
VTEALTRVVKYTYYLTADVSNITIIDTADASVAADLALYYARNGTLWLAVRGGFEIDQEGPIAESYVITDVREFRYDNPRARYMTRQLDPSSDPEDPSQWVPILPAAWTDYAGVTPYGDIDVDADGSDNAVITEQVRYAAGGGPGASGPGVFARQTLDSGQPDETRYLHGDLIRSTILTSDEAGDAATAVAYTAFGEIVGASGPGSPAPTGFPRYQYAGGWGYEADLLVLVGDDTSLPPVTLQHVGARWYDPSIGRFVMRDPIGLEGGPNPYVYCNNEPAARFDPEGEQWATAGPRWARWLLNLTGGQGHVPVLDPGTAQTVVVVTADIISAAAPAGAAIRGVACLSRFKTFRFLNQNRRFRI